MTFSIHKMKKNIKILAISSGGGHWVQLLCLRPAFAGNRVVYATVNKMYRSDIGKERFYTVVDATRWTKFKLVLLLLQIFTILFKEKPDIIISTGAAPGSLAIMLGKYFKAKTIWLDSLANASKISLGGERISSRVDLFLTQWPHLARDGGPCYKGSVL